ncbi:MAG: hypothetical protein ACYTEK_18620, partial [Planctomycetota bacterium]
ADYSLSAAFRQQQKPGMYWVRAAGLVLVPRKCNQRALFAEDSAIMVQVEGGPASSDVLNGKYRIGIGVQRNG